MTCVVAYTGGTYQRWDPAKTDIPSEPFTLEIQAITSYQAGALVALDDISLKPCTVSPCKFFYILNCFISKI